MSGRKHYFDAARAVLMLLGIPYHTALLYDPQHEWVITTMGPRSAALGFVADVIHAFRLPAFFIIAGHFSGLLVARWGAATWFRDRAIRLGVPLLTAALTAGPLQLVALQWAAGAPDPVHRGLAQFASPGPHWLMHLWFLLDLLLLSGAFALAWDSDARRAASRALRRAESVATRHPRLATAAALAAFATWQVANEALVVLVGHTVSWRHVLDLSRLLGFAPFFALGVLLARRPALLDRFTRPSRVALAAALAATGFVAWMGTPHGAVRYVTWCVVSPITGVLMAHAVFGVARRRFDRPSPVVRFLVDGSFTAYVVHQPIIVLLAIAILPLGLPPAAGFALVLAITTVLAVSAHLVVRSHPALLFLVNGVRPRRGAIAAQAAGGDVAR